MGKLRTVHRDSTAHDAYRPTSDDPANKHHGQMRSCRLENGTDNTNDSSNLDGALCLLLVLFIVSIV